MKTKEEYSPIRKYKPLNGVDRFYHNDKDFYYIIDTEHPQTPIMFRSFYAMNKHIENMKDR